MGRGARGGPMPPGQGRRRMLRRKAAAKLSFALSPAVNLDAFQGRSPRAPPLIAQT